MGSAASHSRVEPTDDGAFVHLRNLKKGVPLAGVMAPKEVQFSFSALDGAAYLAPRVYPSLHTENSGSRLAPIVDVCPRTSSCRALDDSDNTPSTTAPDERCRTDSLQSSPSRELRHEESSKAINKGMAPYRLFGPGTCRGSVIEPTFIEPTLELAKTDKARSASQDLSRRKSSSALLLRHVW